MNRKTILVCLALGAGECILLGGVWLGIRHETQTVNRIVNEVSELRDPSPFRAALLGHLGKIHLSLKGYLQSPDPALEKQAEDSRKDFESLLPEFVRQNPKLFPQAASEEIERTFHLYKDTIDRTLDDNTDRLARRATLDQNFSRLLFLIDHNLRPIIRKSQANSEERQEAILNIENQARAWHENLSQAWKEPSETAKALALENDNRGQSFLESYAHLKLLPRERKTQNEIKTLWLANSNIARQIFVMEPLVDLSEKAMDAANDQVVLTLNRYLPAMRPEDLDAKKQTLMSSVRFHLAAACGIGLIGLFSFVAIILYFYRFFHGGKAIPEKPSRPAAEKIGPTLQMDLQGMIKTWSPAAEALYGYAAQDVLGKSIGMLFESESEIGWMNRELHEAKKTSFETTHKNKSGEVIPVRIQFQPVSGAGGKTAAIGLLCSRR